MAQAPQVRAAAGMETPQGLGKRPPVPQHTPHSQGSHTSWWQSSIGGQQGRAGRQCRCHSTCRASAEHMSKAYLCQGVASDQRREVGCLQPWGGGAWSPACSACIYSTEIQHKPKKVCGRLATLLGIRSLLNGRHRQWTALDMQHSTRAAHVASTFTHQLAPVQLLRVSA
jgi:hypothetical protein